MEEITIKKDELLDFIEKSIESGELNAQDVLKTIFIDDIRIYFKENFIAKHMFNILFSDQLTAEYNRGVADGRLAASKEAIKVIVDQLGDKAFSDVSKFI